MLHSRIDHITVTAATLQSGVDYVRDALGVMPQPGGKHPRMGTHNCLLKLGDTLFLEVIAIDPDARPPDRPRWFGLDQRNPQQPAALAMWVARTSDIREAAAASSFSLGDIEPMSRGSLNWLITIPQDGSLPLGGVAPTLIEWAAEPHPAASLPEQGCTLTRLEGFHPEADALNDMLRRIGFAGEFSASSPAAGEGSGLVAHIQTPSGPRLLRSAKPWSLATES